MKMKTGRKGKNMQEKLVPKFAPLQGTFVCNIKDRVWEENSHSGE